MDPTMSGQIGLLDATKNFLPNKFFRLMDLPQEIRLLIWTFVLHIDQEQQARTAHFISNLGHIVSPYYKQTSEGNSVVVLLTNRQIYFEARNVLYDLRQFSIGINQMSCIGNNSKPSTPTSFQAVPATWSARLREHLYLMRKLNIYIHLDKAVLGGNAAEPPTEPDNTISEAIRTALLHTDLARNLASTNHSLHQMLQAHVGNAALMQLPNVPGTMANLHTHGNATLNLHANLPANPATNVNGAATNAAIVARQDVSRALEYQKLDNVMVIKAALEELCLVLSMCGKLRDVNVIYIDTSGDSSPGGLGFNILHPFKTLARSVRCRITYVPIPGSSSQSDLVNTDVPKMEGATFKQDMTYSDTLCHLKAISFVSHTKLPPGYIAEVDRRLDSR